MSTLTFVKTNPRKPSFGLTDHELATMFLEVVPQAMQVIREELRRHRGADISVPQFRIMASVSRQAKTNKELAELIGIGVPSMSKMIQGMVDRALLEKQIAEGDRREVAITLSKSGRQLFESIRGKARLGLAAHMRGLGSGERVVVAESLQIFAQLLSGD